MSAHEEFSKVCQLVGVECGKEIEKNAMVATMEAKYMGLTCLAKKLIRCNKGAVKVEEECLLLARLRHPNIASFIGAYSDPCFNLPVLVYEKMSTSLARCIDRYGVLPGEINYSILRDISLALHYLHGHSPSVVHGDVTANNVLLGTGMSAKLANVGVSKLAGFRRTITDEGCGTLCYQAPELLSSNEFNSKSTDVFSYGVLMLHVLSGRWPVIDLPDFSFDMSISVSFSLSEADCRQEYITEIGSKHPLMDTILHCLSNSSSLRPSMVEILHKVSEHASKFPPLFSNSLEMLRKIEDDAEERMLYQDKPSAVFMDDTTNGMESPVAEIERLRKTVAKLSAQNVALRATVTGKLATSVIGNDLENELPEDLRLLSGKMKTSYSPVQLRQGRLQWTKCADIPIPMFQAQAVVIDGKVYAGGGNTGDPATDRIIFVYDPIQDDWGSLPPAPLSSFGIGQLENELVIIGGKIGQKASRYAFIFDSFTKRWKDSLPMLHTARYSPVIVSHQSSLLALGGLADNGENDAIVVSSIEVINSEDFQWYVAGYLPRSASVSLSSAFAVHDSCYIISGYKSTTADSASKATHVASISELLARDRLTPYNWQTLSETPYYQTTACCLGGCLLAVGGASTPYTIPIHRSIHAFSPTTKSWIFIGNLPRACCHCTAVSLPAGEVLVIGGWIQPGEFKRSPSVYRGGIAL